MLDWFQMGAGAVAGVVLAGLVAVTVYGPSQRALGAAEAEIKLTDQTNIAIGELANEADKSRVLRRLCIERGGVFDFASSECKKTDPSQ